MPNMYTGNWASEPRCTRYNGIVILMATQYILPLTLRGGVLPTTLGCPLDYRAPTRIASDQRSRGQSCAGAVLVRSKWVQGKRDGATGGRQLFKA